MKSEPHVVTVTVPKFCPQPSSFSLSHDLHTLCKWWLQSMCFHFTIYGDFRNSSSHTWSFPSDITIACFTLQRQNRQTSQLQVASIWNQLVSQSQPPSTEQLPSKSLALDDPPPWVRVVQSPRVGGGGVWLEFEPVLAPGSCRVAAAQLPCRDVQQTVDRRYFNNRF